jgi:hypothetical protein
LQSEEKFWEEKAIPMQQKWENKLPKLYEIYSESDPNNPDNYFIGMDRRLENTDALLRYYELEVCLCQLDSNAWQDFKQSVKPYVCAKNDLYEWRQLFDCFNEVKGYLYLKKRAFRDIRFIEVGDGNTPDVCASSEEGTVLLEVKTINKSDVDVCAVKSAKMRRVQVSLSKEFDYKLGRIIAKARDQLFGYQATNVFCRIVFLVVNPDLVNALYSGNKEEVDRFLKKKEQSNPDIKIVCDYQPYVPTFGNGTSGFE